VRAVLLVEGESDAAVVQALASRRGSRLGVPGVEVVSTGGAMAATRTLRALGARPAAVLALCDERESPHVQRALTGPRDALFICRADLEDELIRAVGVQAALDVLAETRDLRSFRTLQGQVEHRDRPVDRQLHRFIAAGSGRKQRIDVALAIATAVGAEPPPLQELLDALAQLT
jgi:hypothetical protein